MSHLRTPGRRARGLIALTVTAASTLAAMTAVAGPAAAQGAAPAGAVQAGQSCTAADLGKRHPVIKSTEVAPTITHFKGWYVTEGTTGSHSVSTNTQTSISVSVGLTGNIQGSFGTEALGMVGASLGLNVQVTYSSTSSVSDTVNWNFNQPGYYGVYKGTKKVTGTYGSLNCNRVLQGDGSWALKWIEGADTGSYTTYTALEEGAVRCEDKVPANSIMAKAQGLLDCGSPAATAKHEAGPVPSAKADAARKAATKATARDAAEKTAARKVAGSTAVSRAAQGLTCDSGFYKIGVPGRSLYWTGPLLAADGVRLRTSTIFSGDLDQWLLCNKVENNGVIEATLVNHRSQWCLTVPEQNAANEGAALQTAPCAEDDLQRFSIYRDVPGSAKIGVQNKYTGSMMGYDRYADGEFIRQYSSGKQDGTGTFTLTGV
ncbi:RICIN domain-containing protein [Streptomyces sp. NPDC049555]|uniref:RICIN domain-containing protein n=1 Tax=Streptomyces sp. NPDC049555 TaxID=3154930 RepID=UPI0034325D9E